MEYGRLGRCAALSITVILILSMLAGCGPSAADLAAVDYTPLDSDDFPVSTPAEQGLDPKLVAQLYHNAAELETIYGLLVLKNGHLIAEGYFNGGSVEQLSARQSVTKSYMSALAGIALEQGCLSSLDQKMIEFFPDLESQIRASDPRKEQITIRDLLQMRSGYQNEQQSEYYLRTLFYSDNWHWLPHIAGFPLTADPGTKWQYSEITYHALAVLVARACATDLITFAREHLFEPIDAELADWSSDADGYNYGNFEIYVTARNMAKFGLLYLNDGEYQGKQVIPANWVHDSLQRHSDRVNVSGWLPGITSRSGYFRDIGYGYGWWAGKAGKHSFNYASGHGGQKIVLLDDLDMVIVATADPLYDAPAGAGWEWESAVIETVGKFIKSLP
jgi:CubicO group peptidase (beta-lactamase class C family)